MKEGQQIVLENWISTETKLNLYLNFKPYTKTNSKQITHLYLHVKYKSLPKKGENSWDLGLSSMFLDLI